MVLEWTSAVGVDLLAGKPGPHGLTALHMAAVMENGAKLAALLTGAPSALPSIFSREGLHVLEFAQCFRLLPFIEQQLHGAGTVMHAPSCLALQARLSTSAPAGCSEGSGCCGRCIAGGLTGYGGGAQMCAQTGSLLGLQPDPAAPRQRSWHLPPATEPPTIMSCSSSTTAWQPLPVRACRASHPALTHGLMQWQSGADKHLHLWGPHACSLLGGGRAGDGWMMPGMAKACLACMQMRQRTQSWRMRAMRMSLQSTLTLASCWTLMLSVLWKALLRVSHTVCAPMASIALLVHYCPPLLHCVPGIALLLCRAKGVFLLRRFTL